MNFDEKEVNELAEEITQDVAEHMLGIVSDVLKEHYEWSNPEISKFLLYMGLEMVKGKGDAKDD